jgi:hypothetical protein
MLIRVLAGIGIAVVVLYMTLANIVMDWWLDWHD